MLGLLESVPVDMLFAAYMRLSPKDKERVIDYLRQFGLLQELKCTDKSRPEAPEKVF